jgi:dihydropteroate synthase
MGILNLTPDSFSDGGSYDSADAVLRRAEEMIGEGADIIDVGGQSSRPGSVQVDSNTELQRVLPAIREITRRFDTPVSVDTFNSQVAQAAIDGGAEIINDISGLRWNTGIAQIAGRTNAGLVLMHSRGTFETMHSEPHADDILSELHTSLGNSIETARAHGVVDSQIVIDIGLGFGKTQEQNLELIAKIGQLAFDRPILVGASRKSFIGRLCDVPNPSERVAGSIAAAVLAIANGAKIVRVHDVRETAQALKVTDAIINAR